jgi:hypothetical protein
MRRLLLIGVLSAVACGGSPTQPQPVTLTGSWSGTLETSNFPTVNVALQLTQSGNAVTGTWATTPVASWNGNVTGTFDGSQFSGAFSIAAASSNGTIECTGSSSVSGLVTNSGNSGHWTGPGFTGGACTNPPAKLVWKIARK